MWSSSKSHEFSDGGSPAKRLMAIVEGRLKPGDPALAVIFLRAGTLLREKGYSDEMVACCC